MALLGHTVSAVPVTGAGAGASRGLSVTFGVDSGRDMLPGSLPALATVVLVWSVADAPFAAVPDELAEPDR